MVPVDPDQVEPGPNEPSPDDLNPNEPSANEPKQVFEAGGPEKGCRSWEEEGQGRNGAGDGIRTRDQQLGRL